eukprot:2699807-Alexandrium_andersonii.AAC.1
MATSTSLSPRSMSPWASRASAARAPALRALRLAVRQDCHRRRLRGILLLGHIDDVVALASC